ncbi:hypothetical protein KIW84_042030 [Lathyrus oleraceus]|uniref:Uncharacterized protein n=1 Tax=Pisum sativum TaxID=3888 RepID=A0A9D4XA76_PEA|nr:hypothetical protein KIW84_042030 [Pisum sativum]
MDVVREEQASFREQVDSVKSKIEKIFEAIKALARREEEAHVAADARNDTLVQGVALQTHVPPPAHTSRVADGVAAQGPPIVNQVVIPRTDEELQDEFEMQNYNGATPMVIPTAAQDSEAILMCPTAQYPTMPYRPIAHVSIPAPIPQYQVPDPQYQAPQSQFQAHPPQHQQRNQQCLERLPKPFVVPYQRNIDLEPAKKIEPMVIYVPAPFSFDSTKEVPWNYEPLVYVDEDPYSLEMVFRGPPDVTLTNWKEIDVPEIVSCSK